MRKPVHSARNPRATLGRAYRSLLVSEASGTHALLAVHEQRWLSTAGHMERWPQLNEYAVMRSKG